MAWEMLCPIDQDGVVMQSTPSSCGPACAATLLRARGIPASERELARESFTSAGGTENWYLARALRRRGLAARFERSATLRVPAIAGVTGAGFGHFIALLSRDGDRYVAADPLVGRIVGTEAQLRQRYTFTGFFLVID